MEGTAAHGTTREWHDAEGWGVVLSPGTPGGCWVHFSHLAVRGFRQLVPGQEVALEWEAAEQDGYAYRAVRVWPWGDAPVDPTDDVEPAGSPAFRSTLRVVRDDPPAPHREPPARPGRPGRG